MSKKDRHKLYIRLMVLVKEGGGCDVSSCRSSSYDFSVFVHGQSVVRPSQHVERPERPSV